MKAEREQTISTRSPILSTLMMFMIYLKFNIMWFWFEYFVIKFVKEEGPRNVQVIDTLWSILYDYNVSLSVMLINRVIKFVKEEGPRYVLVIEDTASMNLQVGPLREAFANSWTTLGKDVRPSFWGLLICPMSFVSRNSLIWRRD